MVEREYEVKIAVENLKEIEKALKEIGAVFEDEVYEEDYYIDLRPCKDLKASDEALRVRISKGSRTTIESYEFTYKGPKIRPDLKVRDEITIEVSDGRALIEIFRRLGFRTYIIRKKRKVYRYGKYKVFLDEVMGLGRFVEIEVEGASNVKEFASEIRKLVSILKLTGSFISKSYLEMILDRIEVIERG